MEFPFHLSPQGLGEIQQLTQTMGHQDLDGPHNDKVEARNTKTKRVRNLKAISYVMLHEALRTRMPGQAQLDAYNNFADFELPNIVREHEQPIEVHTINAVNNVAISIVFTDISIEAPTHTEPDGTRVHLHPQDVGKRHIPYDVNVSVDLCLKQTCYEIIPPLRNYDHGKAFYAPCMLLEDPHNFNGWGLAVGRATTGTSKQHVDNGQMLFFKPGVWDAFHQDACERHNRRSKCPVRVDGYKRQLWSRMSAVDQKTWNYVCSDGIPDSPNFPGMACVKLLVFIGYYDNLMGHFVVEKMGKKTIFDTFGDVLATMPPYIEQCKQLKLGTKTEYVYGIPFIRLPCMLGSNYCHTVRKGMEHRMDSGIVMTGTCDKVVITQQQLGNNRVFLFNQKAGQVIAEVRSAHIGKRRSTSAFRLILSPKDGAYVLLPFLKRASGIDVRVHIVDFIRLMWEYDLLEDPDLEGVSWPLFGKFLGHLKDACVHTHVPVAYRRKKGRPKYLWPLHKLGLSSSQAQGIWDLASTSPLIVHQTKKKRRTSKKKKPLEVTRSNEFQSNARLRKLAHLLLELLGRRTIRNIDAATSVLDLSFFGIQSCGDIHKRFDRYLEIRSFLQDTTPPEYFTKSAGQILTGLAIDGARERTLSAQRSYVLNNVLRSELFPHLSDVASVQVRREKLFYAMNQIFAPVYDLYSGRRAFPSDKDSLGNKRLDMFDEIIGIYFRQQSQSNRGTLAKSIQSEADSGVYIDSKLLYGLIANRRFENSIRYPFNTGKTKLSDKRPGSKKANQNSSGGIQQTSGNVIARISHVRRVRHAHINQDNKAIKPRMVHVKDTRRLCPAESPEGTMCGLLKNIALLVHVSIGITDTNTMAALVHCLVDPRWVRMSWEPPWDVEHVLVINGVIKAFIDPDKMDTMCEHLRMCRRAANMRFDTSIYINESGTTLHVDSNAGRMLDPLIRTESVMDGRFFDVCHNFVQSGGHFSNLIRELTRYGCVDYVCANEEASYWIATSWADWFSQLDGHRRAQQPNSKFVPMFTHMMIHAVALFDYAVASMIFPECNQGPRNTYQAKMLTQAVSLPDQILESSSEGTKYYLNYGQVPLVQSATCLFDNLRQFTSGINCVVQMRRSAFNIEDAVIFNQGSIDRGLFHMTYTYNMLLETEKTQQIEMPNMRTCRNIKQANYSKLDPETGIIRCGAYLSQGDVMVGLTKKVTDFNQGGKVKIDVSLIYTRKIPARVSQITHTTNRFGNPLVNFTVMASNKELPFPVDMFKPPVSGCEPPPSKKRTRKVINPVGRWISTRPEGISVPANGEKFASRAAQKGVVGLIVPEADMDFVCEGPNMGMRADMCFSPDGVPSRMTMGSPMMEMLLGVLGAVLGVQIDGTPFSMTDLDMTELGDKLEKAGQNRFCEETMCSGVTGERICGENHLPGWMEHLDGPKAHRGCVMGIVYYQRLAHFVAAKIHSRNGGPLNDWTRQPTNGRAKKGGLRCGTMEVDALIGHGAAALLRERMLLASDNYYAPVCTLCRFLAETARDGSYFCRNCGMPGTCELVQMPYAAKVMVNLYQAAHLPWRMAISM
jgi:DNA-directed RNA polymerase II subunit RPB2